MASHIDFVILEVLGLAFCNGCGATLAENAKFCIKCGQPVELVSKSMPEDEAVDAITDVSTNVTDDITAVNANVVNDAEAMSLNYCQNEYAAGTDISITPEIIRPAKKVNSAVLISVAVVVLLLLGGGGYYLMKVSSPDRVMREFTGAMENGKYESAFNYLEMADRNSRVRNLDSKADFANWQKTLDKKEGAITSVTIRETVIYGRGWGSSEASGSTTMEVKRGNEKQEMHLRLKSKPSKILGFIPSWQVVYPSDVIDFSDAILLEGTDIYLDGAKCMTVADNNQDRLKVETYAGNHLVSFQTNLSQPVEVFPARDLNEVKSTDFVIKPEVEQAIKQVVVDSVAVESKFWASQGKDYSAVMSISANGAEYPDAIKSQVDDFTDEFDEDTRCKTINRPITISNIYDIEIMAADRVRCQVDAYYTMQVTYTEEEYDYHTSAYVNQEHTWDDNGNYTTAYELVKEGDNWKIYSKI